MEQSKKEELIKQFQTALEAEINKLPYTKHLDDGQFNDGQVSGFELGAEFARDFFFKIIERDKIQLSNYAYQMDVAKRERDQAEERTMKVERELSSLKEENQKLTEYIISSNGKIEDLKEEIQALTERLEEKKDKIYSQEELELMELKSRFVTLLMLESACGRMKILVGNNWIEIDDARKALADKLRINP